MRFIPAKLTINGRVLKPLLLVFVMLLIGAQTRGQNVLQMEQVLSQKSDSLPEVLKCAGDSLASSFVIFIRDRVKKHKHAKHAEHVYILEGKGEIQLGDSLFEVTPGMLIFIPAGTVHAVRKKGKKALKVLSIQAPKFDGTDRIYVE